MQTTIQPEWFHVRPKKNLKLFIHISRLTEIPTGHAYSLVPLRSHKTRLLGHLVRYLHKLFFFASAKTVRLMSFFFFSFCYSDILAFFQGSPDGSIPGRDDLAKEIAAHAHEFVQERWREEDMRSFMYLLILEVSLVFAHPTKSTFWC